MTNKQGTAPELYKNSTPIKMLYKNYRGEVSTRTIVPVSIFWGATEWHPEPCWLLKAYDFDKHDHRDFALKDAMFADLEQQIATAKQQGIEEDEATVERVARVFEPEAWRRYDNALRPYIEGRGANGDGENTAYRITQREGCKKPEDVKLWYLVKAAPPHVTTEIDAIRKSLVRAKAAIRALKGNANE